MNLTLAVLVHPHFTIAAHLANVLRLAVMFLGGSVIGAGTVILHGRARFYARLRMPTATKCMYVLAAMNLLVLAYITLNMLARWGMGAIGWPTLGALVVFTCKGWFFALLRRFALEQERDLLAGDLAWHTHHD